ncbi:hypothetical protein HBI70_193260 [Parastagonospora nodorum]|nr:hypothetical protein HBH47_166520 [Parastagonospora nodorum]KAH4198043.1 hypothetical protein HBI95_183710 [Parastagonospora nodorum]KAH4257093.1 hypothetical protein HBI03_157110 [Parastagonospora nodorum]KAH4269845.1 hypothetical protein HBI04_152110 [Parastagonospora nodorum]KAH5025770.1 hypothetical protein HBI75_142460 [Parastagonospora nodorum]
MPEIQQEPHTAAPHYRSRLNHFLHVAARLVLVMLAALRNVDASMHQGPICSLAIGIRMRRWLQRVGLRPDLRWRIVCPQRCASPARGL